MLDEKIVPNGVGTGKPPAKFLPPRTVWQAIAIAERGELAAALDLGGIERCGLAAGSIAAIAGRQATAKAAAAPPTSSTATTPPMIPDFFIRASRF